MLGQILDKFTGKNHIDNRFNRFKICQAVYSAVYSIHGEWVELRAGQQIKLDIAVGETPGGQVGLLLQLEEKGVKYEMTSDGNPILPLFTTAPISKKEEKELKEQYGDYKLDFENVLVFSQKR